MTDDELMNAIAKVRSQHLFDARYEALSCGNMTREELAQLESQTKQSSPDALALEAFRPLSDAARMQMVKRIEVNRSKGAVLKPVETQPDVSDAITSPVSQVPRSRLQRSYYWQIATPVAVGALAAAMAVLVTPSRPSYFLVTKRL